MARGVGLSLLAELRDTRGLQLRLAYGALLMLIALTTLHVVIRPGPLDARSWRRRPLPGVIYCWFTEI